MFFERLKICFQIIFKIVIAMMVHGKMSTNVEKDKIVKLLYNGTSTLEISKNFDREYRSSNGTPWRVAGVRKSPNVNVQELSQTEICEKINLALGQNPDGSSTRFFL